MIPIDLIEDYLVDQEDGLKKLLTWFLNLVMQLLAMDRIEAEPYERADSRKVNRNGYKGRTLKIRLPVQQGSCRFASPCASIRRSPGRAPAGVAASGSCLCRASILCTRRAMRSWRTAFCGLQNP